MDQDLADAPATQAAVHPQHPAPTEPLAPPVSAGIVPRTGLDFGLDETVPRHWFAGDPFKTRFFDAMSALFPVGEAFFIACVRDFRDRIQDPELLQAVRDFSIQEAQHSKHHSALNRLLARQGVKIDKLEGNLRHYLFDIVRKRLRPEMSLAVTAAAEHMTAIMAHSFFERGELFEGADPRVLALFGWHAVEEVEHKAVAFDVMQKVARVGWGRRSLALLYMTLDFPRMVFSLVNHMLKVDGFSRWQRIKLFARGVAWLYAPGGLMGALIGPYLAWYRPGFHPWQQGRQASYPVWAEALARSGDPVVAMQAVTSAARHPQPQG